MPKSSNRIPEPATKSLTVLGDSKCSVGTCQRPTVFARTFQSTSLCR